VAKPPSFKQRRYRGRIRSDIRSSLTHLKKLIAWNVKYLAAASDNYPNQLAIPADMVVVAGAAVLLQGWLDIKGPIPSRV
jgi:hypothetical protein